MNFYVAPFKLIPLGYNTLVPAFFPILEALLICTFWYVLKLSQRFGFYLLNRGKRLSWVSSILGTGRSHRGLNLVSTMAEA